jgi:hypothetical protein
MAGSGTGTLAMDKVGGAITRSVRKITKLAWEIAGPLLAVKAILWALGYVG